MSHPFRPVVALDPEKRLRWNTARSRGGEVRLTYGAMQRLCREHQEEESG